MAKLYAMVYHFGLPTWFVTISPAINNYPLMHMMSLGHTPQPYRTIGIAPQHGTIQIQLPSLSERAEMLARDPVAAAQMYERLLEAFLSELIGLSQSHKIRKSHPPIEQRSQGVLGIPVAFLNVNECQGRGTLHMHGGNWADLQPHVLQEFVDDPEATAKICARLDSIVCAFLPDRVWEIHEQFVRDREAGTVRDDPHRDQFALPPTQQKCAQSHK